MGQVNGKVAIVTGGASGIGAACAAILAREDAKVVITDLDDAAGQAVAEKVGGAGGEAIYLHHDVTVEEGWPAIIETAERRFGRLNVMVANAGIGILCQAVEMSLADWRRQIAVNLDGVFLSVKYAIPAMRRAGGSGRPQGIGRFGRLLRHERRRAHVRKSGRHGVCGSGRRGSDQYRPSGGHRHADLDKDSGFSRPQRADRSERSCPNRGTVREGGNTARHRKRRALPRLGCVQLYDGRGGGDRRRDDGWRKTALDLILQKLERWLRPILRRCELPLQRL